MNKIKNLIMVGIAASTIGVSLGACSHGIQSNGSDKTSKSGKSTLKAGKYELVYQDQEADGDSYGGDGDTPTDVFGIVLKGKVHEYSISADRVNEKVALKYADKPYVVVREDDSIVIYRGPYQQYIQPAADGTVTKK